ncbi:helix-turn-helix domain-containing protein [Mucilaginibacter mali]|uniref:Helix-turn-helix domain-containing protein n=1 Tax=Mucilaginibacter mali TaxID=2740462 RepID=A0A7D4U9L3_9SPHI|nr:helix-turn-helix domain-containing protein [Mucilaginibacter mali]QKJ29158.1 helix-turn-helix domain-containing protein [Mucilaginibacter mali]
MEKNILGEKIKDLRIGKGYSQDHLSNLAQLSLRTVQRIENGETEARGDTLNRLAKALEVSIDELMGIKLSTGNNNGYLALINISGLACMFVSFPLLGILLPVILRLAKKGKIADIDDQVKTIINFQITWTLLGLGVFMLLMMNIAFFHVPIFHGLGGLGAAEVMLLIPILIFITNAVQVLINAARIWMHKEVKYWPVIRFIK